MRITIISILAAFAATALGIEIKTPAVDQKVAQDNSIVIRWSSVSTDPATVDIYLVNLAVYPNTRNLIATGVDTGLGEYTIKGKDINVDPGKGYQVNFVSTINDGILAQSQQFNVIPKASEASASGKDSSTASGSLSTSSTYASDSMLHTSFSASTFPSASADTSISSTSASYTSSSAVSTDSTTATHSSISSSTHTIPESPHASSVPASFAMNTPSSTMMDTVTSPTTSAHTKTISSTSAISTTTNAAGILSPPQVGSLFLGFMALVF